MPAAADFLPEHRFEDGVMDRGGLVVTALQHRAEIGQLGSWWKRCQWVGGAGGYALRELEPQRMAVENRCQHSGGAKLGPNGDATERLVSDGSGQVVVVALEKAEVVISSGAGPFELEQGRMASGLRRIDDGGKHLAQDNSRYAGRERG